METAYNNIPTTNRFSWKRTWMVGKFYLPRLRKQLIFYPVITIALLTIFLAGIVADLDKLVLITTLPLLFGVGIMLAFGPLIFASSKGIEIETTLPATAAEKATFIFCYTYLIIPLLVIIPIYIADCATGSFIMENKFIAETVGKISTETYSYYILQSNTQYILLMSICLFGIMKFKQNRIILSIVSVIGGNIVLGLIGALYGFVMAFTEENAEQLTALNDSSIITSGISGLITVIAIFCTITSVIFAILTYRIIKTRQI